MALKTQRQRTKNVKKEKRERAADCIIFHQLLVFEFAAPALHCDLKTQRQRWTRVAGKCDFAPEGSSRSELRNE